MESNVAFWRGKCESCKEHYVTFQDRSPCNKSIMNHESLNWDSSRQKIGHSWKFRQVKKKILGEFWAVPHQFIKFHILNRPISHLLGGTTSQKIFFQEDWAVPPTQK